MLDISLELEMEEADRLAQIQQIAQNHRVKSKKRRHCGGGGDQSEKKRACAVYCQYVRASSTSLPSSLQLVLCSHVQVSIYDGQVLGADQPFGRQPPEPISKKKKLQMRRCTPFAERQDQPRGSIGRAETRRGHEAEVHSLDLSYYQVRET